jgi:phosphatidylserine decarboxylase
VDYHRLHTPVSGVLKKVSWAGRTLYAVEVGLFPYCCEPQLLQFEHAHDVQSRSSCAVAPLHLPRITPHNRRGVVSSVSHTAMCLQAAAVTSPIDIYGENERAILEIDSPVGLLQVVVCTAALHRSISRSHPAGHFSAASAVLRRRLSACVNFPAALPMAATFKCVVQEFGTVMYCIIGASQVGSVVMSVKEGAHLKKVSSGGFAACVLATSAAPSAAGFGCQQHRQLTKL